MASAIGYKLQQILNPFQTTLYKSNTLPTIRAEFTGFKKKWQDTYQVFKGGTSFREKRYYRNAVGKLVPEIDHGKTEPKKFRQPFRYDTRPGIFDYATVGIFKIAHYLLDQTRKTRKELGEEAKKSGFLKKIRLNLIKLSLSLPHLVLFLTHVIGNGIIRPIVAFAATLALTPVIFLAHVISKLAAKIREINVTETLEVGVPTGFHVNNDPRQGLALQTAKLQQVLGNNSIRKAKIECPTDASGKKYCVAIYPTKNDPQPVAYVYLKEEEKIKALMSVNKSTRVAVEGEESTKPRYRR